MLTLEHLWHEARFKPKDNQRQAIVYMAGPLYLPAGPGPGKTRVLLWRALDLIIHELSRWEPVIPIPLEPEHIAETVRQFGAVVDLIEDGCFAPADLATLQGRLRGTTCTFASEICRRCDARFSCAPYHAYAHAASQGTEARFRQYFDDFGDDIEQGELVTTGLQERA